MIVSLLRIITVLELHLLQQIMEGHNSIYQVIPHLVI